MTCQPNPNMALNLAPFGRWTLRHKAAQRRLALRYVQESEWWYAKVRHAHMRKKGVVSQRAAILGERLMALQGSGAFRSVVGKASSCADAVMVRGEQGGRVCRLMAESLLWAYQQWVRG